MTQEEEKAKELVEKFEKHFNESDQYSINLDSEIRFYAKQCAIICVNEIIYSKPISPQKSDYIMLESELLDNSLEYWNKVLIEIEKL